MAKKQTVLKWYNLQVYNNNKYYDSCNYLPVSDAPVLLLNKLSINDSPISPEWSPSFCRTASIVGQ